MNTIPAPPRVSSTRHDCGRPPAPLALRGRGMVRVLAWLGVAVLAASSAWAQKPPATSTRETWDAIYLSNTKVGHIHTQITPLVHNGRNLTRVQVTTVMDLKREKDVSRIELRFGTIEAEGGEVLRIDSRIKMGGQDLQAGGDVVNGRMNFTLKTGGRTTSQIIEWTPETRGPYHPELDLKTNPLKPGESRTYRIFLPQLNQLALATLTGIGKETTPLYGANREVYRVDGKVTDLNGKSIAGMNTTYYLNNEGEVVKTVTDVYGGMTTVRTTKETALAPGGSFDIVQNFIISSRFQIANPYQTRQVQYNVSMKDAAVASIFAVDNRQSLTPGSDPKTGRLVVRAMGPEDGQPEPGPVAEEYLEPNPIVDSEDSRVVQHMKAAVGNATDPWTKAQRIQDWVHRNMVDKNFEVTFATASETARALSGDCTEHAVLVAAMCRAAKIPARVAIGFIYVDRLRGFGYHMWTEVYVNNRWVGIDASFQQNVVDAVHIKLKDTSLKGVSPFEQFQTVVETASKLSIEPVEVR